MTTMTGQHDVSFDDDTIPTSFVLDRELRDALRKPFPPNMIGKVNKGFGMVDFIGHAAITDRLNQAAPGWTYRIEPVVITGKDGLPHCMAVFGTMTVGGVTRQEVGDVEHMTRYGDELKKAISDFICRGAMRFGVGLDLWSKEDLGSPSRETPPGTKAVAPTVSSPGGTTSAPSGRRPSAQGGGADGRDGVDKTSSVPPTSSSAGTTEVTGEGASDPAGDLSPGGEPAPHRSSQSGRGQTGAEPPGASRRKKKYPLDPRDCLHTVGVDVDGLCVDCGAPLTEAVP